MHGNLSLSEFLRGLHRFYAERALSSFWMQGKVYCDWHYYDGPDCEPVNFYLRFGRTTLIVANMNGYARPKGREKIMTKPAVNCGRMPVLLNSLDKAAPRVVFESVINPFLGKTLLRNGYQPTDQLTYGCSFYKEFEVPPIDSVMP